MKEIVYFSHDANAINDTKILNLRADYGLEGYGLFWAIVEQLRCEEEYSMQLNKNTFRALKVLTGTNIDIEKYINDCIHEYGLFEEADGKFYSKSLKKRMAIKDQKKTKRSEAGKKGAEKRWNDNSNTLKNGNAIKNDSNAMNIDGNAIKNNSKKWQSKGKEKKVKESKENKYILTKLNETIDYIFNNNSDELKGFHTLLQRLDLDFTDAESFNKYVPISDRPKFRMIYFVLYELYNSSYSVFLGKLSKEKLINKLKKTEKYIHRLTGLPIEQYPDFINYYIKSLQEDFEMRC